MNLDSIDVSIINSLQDNSRISLSELSKKINLSISAVSERIKKLESANVIQQYTTILEPSSLNKNFSAIMLISLDDPNKISEFLDFINSNSEILECYHITGDFDYLLKIITTNTEGMEDIINKIRMVSVVRKTQTCVILSAQKHFHSILPTVTKE